MIWRRTLLVCLAIAAAAILTLRPRPHVAPVTVVEQPLSDLPAVEATEWTPDLRPPRVAEVLVAVERVFTRAIPREAVQAHRALSGDFNGDRSPDLAVPARVVPALLPVINDDLANWIVQDPQRPAAQTRTAGSPRVRIDERDLLLAVVHGLGPSGWRDASARQGYLLKAAPRGALAVVARERVEAAAQREARRIPRLRGDLLRESAGGRFLFWTGARYLWHEPHRAAEHRRSPT